MFKTKRNLLIMIVILVLSASIIGCSNNQGDSPVGEGDEQGQEPSDNVKAGPAIDKDTVVIATADETPSVSATDHNLLAGKYVNNLTYNCLFRQDRDLKPVPDLVAEYNVEKDENGEETIWVMTLHEGVKFHDGSILTSDDVVASLKQAKTKPEVFTYTTSFVDVEKINDLTFKIFTDGPSAILLSDLMNHGNAIRPKALIDAGNNFNENPIGTGPYKFVEWTRGEQLKFTAHEDYFDSERAPKIKNIIWKIIPEGSSRTIALESGEIDYIIELDTTSIDNVTANDNLELIRQPSVTHNWLTVNNEKEPFGDRNVRKAICSAINREDVLTVAIDGEGIIARGQTPEGRPGFSSEGFDDYDLEEAKAYMEAWGGDPASIELDIICSNDTKRRAAQVIQDNLKQLGINSTLSSMDLATYMSTTASGDYTGFIGGFTGESMIGVLQSVWHSRNINASNKTRTDNPELDALLEEAARTVDQEKHIMIIEEISKLLNFEAYQMPLYQNNIISARKANLQNTFVNASTVIRVEEWSWK